MNQILHFQASLQVNLTWPLTFICELWPHEHLKVLTLHQQTKFGSNKVNFIFWAHLTTGPLMTFILGIWPLTTWTYKGSHIVSINHVWFQSDFNFSYEATSTFSAFTFWHLTTWPQMTFDLECDLWPHQIKVLMLHLWPNFGWNPLQHVDSRAKW